jgi:hypothetical protein
VRAAVAADGLERALERLRDAGVYTSYEEWLGEVPVRRRGQEASFRPADFVNPLARPDFLAGTGGTRSGGIPIAWSFEALRRGVDPYLLRAETWGVGGAPAAIWLPAQPSAAGLATALLLAAAGAPPERWFTPAPSGSAAPRDRAVDRVLHLLARSAGVRLPRPRAVSPARPDAVLEWCLTALRTSRRARLGAYTGSAVRLAGAARAAGVSLDGLVVATLGEPLGAERAAAIRASGAEPANGYGFMQKGTVAHACPACGDEELHLLESEAALISRRRRAPGGEEVDAFCWSSLDPDSPTVMLNTENDDHGELRRDARPCECELGALGFDRRLVRVRGASKASAEGMTVRAEEFAELVGSVLPAALGGGPADFQFVQRGGGERPRITLRIDPAVGPVDEERTLELVRGALRRTAAGGLAGAVWEQAGTLALERVEPRRSRSGKLLPLELG